MASIDPATLMLSASLMSGTCVSSSIIVGHSNKIGNLVWRWVYWSNSERILYKESQHGQFVYLLINLALKNEDQKHVRRVHLDQDILFLLKASPLESDFFRMDGSVKRSFIYVPTDGFYVKSKRIWNGKRPSWTWLYVVPITDGAHIIGFDVWTYQWWWDWVDLTPSQSNRAMRETIEEYMKFNGMKKRLANISLKKKEYRDFLVSLYDQGLLQQKVDAEVELKQFPGTKKKNN